MRSPSLRQKVVHHMRERLNRDGYPRLQMLLLVVLTALAGALASFTLLHLGVAARPLRYPLSVGLAYLVFLALLWVWLRAQAHEVADALPDLAEILPTPDRWTHAGEVASGGGGDLPDVFSPATDALGASAEAEEFAIPLMLLILLAVVVLASFMLVYSAPVLLAELMVDGALATGLYRRLRRLETQHWLETALRRTWIPFGLTAVVATLVGWAMTL